MKPKACSPIFRWRSRSPCTIAASIRPNRTAAIATSSATRAGNGLSIHRSFFRNSCGAWKPWEAWPTYFSRIATTWPTRRATPPASAAIGSFIAQSSPLSPLPRSSSMGTNLWKSRPISRSCPRRGIRAATRRSTTLRRFLFSGDHLSWNRDDKRLGASRSLLAFLAATDRVDAAARGSGVRVGPARPWATSASARQPDEVPPHSTRRADAQTVGDRARCTSCARYRYSWPQSATTIFALVAPD